ncbi:MAG: hypothetical protein MUC87_05135 [Bacteroidia bacterium]|jgi:hypothetical protein|nr:hypothetical protein [Bacteroidia bacterium]
MERVHQPSSPSSQQNSLQPGFPAEMSNLSDLGDDFKGSGNPAHLVQHVQRQMMKGKKLSVREMQWAFSFGGWDFHQRALGHNLRMRLREEADGKSEKQSESGVQSEKQSGLQSEKQSESGVKGSGGENFSGMGKDSSQAQNLTSSQTASPLSESKATEHTTNSSQAQNLTGSQTASPLSEFKATEQNTNSSQAQNLTASPLSDAKKEQPLSPQQRSEVQKVNGQVTPLDATKNAVEQPAVINPQPKMEETEEEKRRKEGVNHKPELKEPAADKSEAISQIESSHDKVMESEVREAESQLPVKAKRTKGQPTLLEPKPGTEVFKSKTGLPEQQTSTESSAQPLSKQKEQEDLSINKKAEDIESQSLKGDEKLSSDLSQAEENIQSQTEKTKEKSEEPAAPEPVASFGQEIPADTDLAGESISESPEGEEEPLPIVEQAVLEGLKAQVIAAGDSEKAKMHEQNAARRAAFSMELAQSRANYQLEMQAVCMSISTHFSSQRSLISTEASRSRKQIEQHYKKQQQALTKTTGDKRLKLFEEAENRKNDFLQYVSEQKQEPYNIAANEGKRVDTELNQAAISSVSVGNQVAAKYPGNDDTRKEQRKAAIEVSLGARDEILAQKQPMKEDLMARAEEFDGGFDQYTDDTILQIENTRDQIAPELDKLNEQNQQALTAQYKAAIDAVTKNEKAALAVLAKQEKSAIQKFKQSETRLLEESVQAEQELFASLEQQDLQTELEIDQMVEHSITQLVPQPGVEETAYQTLTADSIAEIQNTAGSSVTETAELTDELKNKLSEGFTSSVAKSNEGAVSVNAKATKLANATKAGFAKTYNGFKTESQKLADKLPVTLDKLIDGAYTEVDKAIKERKGKLKATNDKFRDELKAETDENLLAAKAPLTDDLKERATEAAEEAGKSWWEAVLDAIGSIIVGLLIVIALAIVLVALGLCSTILGAMLLIGMVMMAFTFLSSLVNRLQMGQGWEGVGWALADAFGVTGLIESSTGKDSWTGETLSDYQRTKRGTESGITVLLTLLGARGARGPKRLPMSVRNSKLRLNYTRTVKTIKNSKPSKTLSKYNQKLKDFGEFNRQQWGGGEMPRTWQQKTYKNISEGFGLLEKDAGVFFRGIDKTVNTLVVKPIAGIIKAPKTIKSVFTPKPKTKLTANTKSQRYQPVDEFVDNEYLNQEYINRWEKRTKRVEPDMRLIDENKGLVVNGEYLDNPTAMNIEDIVVNPQSGKLRMPNQKQVLDGQFMFVIDIEGNIIIGTRAKGYPAPFDGKAPHPTLIGGKNPITQGAGIVEFRGGKIYSVDNISGHFKPFNEMIIAIENSFMQKFSSKSFSPNFEGFKTFKK